MLQMRRIRARDFSLSVCTKGAGEAQQQSNSQVSAGGQVRQSSDTQAQSGYTTAPHFHAPSAHLQQVGTMGASSAMDCIKGTNACNSLPQPAIEQLEDFNPLPLWVVSPINLYVPLLEALSVARYEGLLVARVLSWLLGSGGHLRR